MSGPVVRPSARVDHGEDRQSINNSAPIHVRMSSWNSTVDPLKHHRSARSSAALGSGEYAAEEEQEQMQPVIRPGLGWSTVSRELGFLTLANIPNDISATKSRVWCA
ncbi:hypothetical protein R1flu_014704 [Riccia fluitans]|uniref:Uncharacterized protein n=1 Tax=Riccia fluitans TaxID=41844 RepID=A0ABD1YGU7_9MARC